MKGGAFSIWAPPLVYIPTIFVLSIRPMPDTIPNNMDKLIHVAVYSLMGLLFTRTLVNGMHIDKKKTAIAIALFSSILLGALIEVAQHFIPYRDASFLDMVANGAGAFIGVFLYSVITKAYKRQNHTSS